MEIMNIDSKIKEETFSGGRNQEIDELRGIAIELVIIGHIIQYVFCPSAFDENILFRIIYSFHMPLFMYISGYTVWYQKKELTAFYVVRRVGSLLCPFFVWAVLDEIIKYFSDNERCIIRNAILKIKNPESGLWFLVVLAEITIAFYCAQHISKKIGTWAYIVINIFLLIMPFRIFSFGLLKIHYTFFVFGYLLPELWTKVNPKWKIVIYVFIAIGFPIGVSFWMRSDVPLFYDTVEQYLIRLRFDHALIKVWNMLCDLYRLYFVPILGIGFVVLLYKSVRSLLGLKIKRGLAYIGTNTMELYSMQWYFWKIVRTDNRWVDSCAAFIFSLLCCLLIGEILQRNKVLSFVLFGKSVKKKNDLNDI